MIMLFAPKMTVKVNFLLLKIKAYIYTVFCNLLYTVTLEYNLKISHMSLINQNKWHF